MAEIPYYKMAGSGNTFIVVDNRKNLIKNPNQFAANVCKSPESGGADGVLLIEKSKEKETDFFMRIVNADGSEAEACGNGYRCVGLYAAKHLKISNPRFIRVGTLGGTVEINAASSKAIKVKMIDPFDYRAEMKIPLKDRTLTASFLNTGVPHTVIFVGDLKNVPVDEWGRLIRYHELFVPKGTNVNFVEITGKNSLSIRTYERGVEGETLACGTGSVAAAIAAHLNGRVNTPVEVLPKSGEHLKVYFDRSGSEITNVYLEGPAEFVFEGRLAA
ncbi:MAG: diaminopimelate epimerase [Candidatus Omnitrophica bacterium]|nr:diaminopimelate epimerase [Candidatus Omnitrophota bacterium]